MNGAIGCLMIPFLLPILIVIVLFVILIKKGIKQSYIGTIVEKIHNTTEDDDKVSHLYSIKVKIDGSERVHAIAVSKELYASLSEGDRVEKKSGERMPHKVS